MEGGVFLGLPLPVMLAFVVLLFGLALVARQLHQLCKPAVVRPDVRPDARADGRDPGGRRQPGSH